MNKTDLIHAFADAARLQKKQAAELVEIFMNVIVETLAKHQDIKLLGFGAFKISEVKSKTVVNPKNKQLVEVKEYKRVRFVPGQNLKNKINKR